MYIYENKLYIYLHPKNIEELHHIMVHPHTITFEWVWA